MTKIDLISENSKVVLNPLVPPIDKFFQIRDFAKYTIANGDVQASSIPDIAAALNVSIEQVKHVMCGYIEEQKLLSPFSFYKSPIKSTIPSKKATIIEIYKLIKGNTYAAVTAKLREIENKKLSNDFKTSHLDYVTFSGTFESRSETNLINHSNFICIDLDNLEDVEGVKSQLVDDPETHLLFTSPRGNGLKWVTSFDSEKYPHKDYFKGLTAYLKDKYNLEVDPSGKDVSRACFLGHDEKIFINPKYYIHD